MKELKIVVFFTLFSVAAMTSGYWMWLVLLIFPLSLVLLAPGLVILNTIRSLFFKPHPSPKKVETKVYPIAASRGANEVELTFLPINF